MKDYASTIPVLCKCCRQVFKARVADRKRGWAKYCSKSCKAKKQSKNIGLPDVVTRNYREKAFNGDIRNGI